MLRIKIVFGAINNSRVQVFIETGHCTELTVFQGPFFAFFRALWRAAE